MPSAYDRLADFLPLEQLDAKLRELHARVARMSSDMPTHADVHRALLRTQSRSHCGLAQRRLT